MTGVCRMHGLSFSAPHSKTLLAAATLTAKQLRKRRHLGALQGRNLGNNLGALQDVMLIGLELHIGKRGHIGNRAS